MTIVPLFGHGGLRARFAAALARGTLPAAILLHGPRGVGKQRLALWVAQLLLCDAPVGEPCGECRACRFALALRHPDLHWYFPRPRPKDSDPAPGDVEADYAEAIADRVAGAGLYATPSGSDAIFVATVRAIVQQAVKTPAIAKRKVFVIGDADRMVPQEGTEFAANAFLKLLEEPPADTVLLLTSSEPGALLPTVRSRVVAQRVAPLSEREVRQFLTHESVSQRLSGDDTVPADPAERVAVAGGAPGRLLSGEAWQLALVSARQMLEAAARKGSAAAAPYEAAWAQASAKARGAFADSLDALSTLLHERARTEAQQGAAAAALAATRAMEAVEVAKERVTSNVSPQLITANLLRELQELLT